MYFQIFRPPLRNSKFIVKGKFNGNGLMRVTLGVQRIRLACGDPIMRQYAPTDILAKGSW